MSPPWPPSDETLSEYREQIESYRIGQTSPLTDDEVVFQYSMELLLDAVGGQEFGSKYHVNPTKFGKTPYMNDGVRGALTTLADILEAEPSDGWSLRNEVCLKFFNDVIYHLMKNNEGDDELFEQCYRVVVEGSVHPPNRGCFRASNIQKYAKQEGSVHPPNRGCFRASNIQKYAKQEPRTPMQQKAWDVLK